ncbi:hypothetical protein F750_0254 [Streptomyces sp. PAMC 26508]|nr:hypothetical protein F750_0254 [Streptomyces sp. PAMC 26508]
MRRTRVGQRCQWLRATLGRTTAFRQGKTHDRAEKGRRWGVGRFRSHPFPRQ